MILDVLEILTLVTLTCKGMTMIFMAMRVRFGTSLPDYMSLCSSVKFLRENQYV